MNCKFITKLYDYINNESDNKNKRVIEKHLQNCPVCKKELNTLYFLKSEFKKNIQNPAPAIFYRIKKQIKINKWTDFICFHKKIFGFSATFAFIIAGTIFFNVFFSKSNFTVNEFLNDIYNFNTVEENIFETIATVNIFNND